MYAEYGEPKTAAELMERYARIKKQTYRAPPKPKLLPAPDNTQVVERRNKPTLIGGFIHEHNAHVILYHKWRIAEELGQEVRYSVRDIAEDILGDYECTWEILLSEKRDLGLSYLRHAIVYAVMQELPQLSLPQLGRKFNRDHTTILHSRNRTESMIAKGKTERRESPMGREYHIIKWEPTKAALVSRAWRIKAGGT